MTDATMTTPVKSKRVGCTPRYLVSNTNTPTTDKTAVVTLNELSNHSRSPSYSPIDRRTKAQVVTGSEKSYSPKNMERKMYKLTDGNKENLGSRRKNSLSNKQSNSFINTPITVPPGILGIRKRLQQQMSATCNKSFMGENEISPGLAKIQNTPGTLKKRRQELIVKHKDIQDRSDQLGVGGGVTMWPEMDIVRMKTKDMLSLISSAMVLSLITVMIFNKIHGKTFMQLQTFMLEVRTGCENHKVTANNGSTTLNSEVLKWHKFLLMKSELIKNYFYIPVTSSHCVLYLIIYSFGMSTLVYFLVDNMHAKNRLTPLRIKTWTCLLFVIGTWTILMAFGLYLAFRLEQEAVKCVRQYASLLGHLVLLPIDLSIYQSVLLYWKTCLLDNSSDGLIQVLGIVTVKDLIFYLHYYSIPVATVLLTPVIKLVMSFWTVYGSDIINKVS